MDIRELLRDLQSKAGEVASDLNLEDEIDSAKTAMNKVKERLETDPNARNAAMGGGALLMLLMASKGGRKLVGNVAKTGAVAAVGAMAYKAWKERNGGEAGETAEKDAASAGFVTDSERNPNFSRAIVETMLAAAHADGEIDAAEMEMIDAAMKDAGIELHQLNVGQAQEAVLERIAAAARTPNHASQLYAAAALVTDNPTGIETSFLEALADRLGIAPNHAMRMREEAAQV